MVIIINYAMIYTYIFKKQIRNLKHILRRCRPPAGNVVGAFYHKL